LKDYAVQRLCREPFAATTVFLQMAKRAADSQTFCR
jgi:hypothetical protein